MPSVELKQMRERYDRALDAFVRGNPEPQKQLYSRREDATLANPLGPPVRGWSQIEPTLDRAAGLLRDGDPVAFELVSECETPELAYLVRIERTRLKLAGAADHAGSSLRVTTIFRREDGTWKIAHRHADPIVVPQPPQSLLDG
jgi:ketosteroid isomerase-like protein